MGKICSHEIQGRKSEYGDNLGSKIDLFRPQAARPKCYPKRPGPANSQSSPVHRLQSQAARKPGSRNHLSQVPIPRGEPEQPQRRAAALGTHASMRTRYGVRRPGAGGPGDQLGERAFGVHRSARKVKCFTTEQPQCPRPSCLRKAFHHLLKLSRQMEDLGSQVSFLLASLVQYETRDDFCLRHGKHTHQYIVHHLKPDGYLMPLQIRII
jgi:hypothetical protein